MGDVLRGRVGKKRDLSDMDPMELSQIEVRREPRDMDLQELSELEVQPANPAAKQATAAGEVLRSPVGRDPRFIARQLSELLQDGTPPEQIDQADAMLASQGMTSEQRIEKYGAEAKKQAVTDYATRRSQSAGKYQDAMSKATADRDGETTVQKIIMGIGDLIGASKGQGQLHQVSDRFRAGKDKAFEDATGAAKSAYETESSVIDSEESASGLAEEAAAYRQMAREAGIRIADGTSDQAVVKTFGPILQKRLGRDPKEASSGGPSEWQKYQIGRNESEDARRSREREEDLARHSKERVEDLALRTTAANKPTEAQNKAGVYYQNMQRAVEEMGGIDYDASAMSSGAEGVLPNAVQSEGAQRQKQAQEAWAESWLRFSSGGAITPEEIVNTAAIYFPRAGDKPEQVKQKERARADVTNAVKSAAGSAAPAGGGQVRVSNGTETLMIDAADLKDAEADGFRQVQ